MTTLCAVLLIVGLAGFLREPDMRRDEWFDGAAWGVREWRDRMGAPRS